MSHRTWIMEVQAGCEREMKARKEKARKEKAAKSDGAHQGTSSGATGAREGAFPTLDVP